VHRLTEGAPTSSGARFSLDSWVFRAKTAGTVFIHGLFFPHDADPSGFFNTLAVGSNGPDHRPTAEATIRANREWFRPAYLIK
jgi:hypothetical protein